MDERSRREDPLLQLSKRERLIAERFAEGLTYREIGEALYIAPTTVRTHIAAIYGKLGIRNKAALVRIWTEARNRGGGTEGEETPRVGEGQDAFFTGRTGADLDEPAPGLRAAIAVLPFENLAGDERWTRLADGISEDIITDLARHGDLTVIARSSSFAFRDRHVDVREIGRQLGVRYLLEGSIQAADGRIRVTAQLIDAQTRAHLWAERYDRDEGDLFAVQDDVVQQVAGALLGWEGRISRAERRRARRGTPSSLAAYERYLLAYEAEAKLTRAETMRAIELVESALALDPTLARAWLVRAYALHHAVLFGWTENPEATKRAYEQSIVRAHELDPADGAILIEVGDLRTEAGDLAGARAAYEEAARVAANHGDTLALLAKYFAGTLGRPEEARAMMQRAFRFNPGAPPLYFYNQLRVAYLLGDFQDAIAAARQSPDTAVTKLFLAMSLARLGRDAESEEVVRALRRDHPEFNPMRVCGTVWLLDARAQAAVREGLHRIGQYTSSA